MRLAANDETRAHPRADLAAEHLVGANGAMSATVIGVVNAWLERASSVVVEPSTMTPDDGRTSDMSKSWRAVDSTIVSAASLLVTPKIADTPPKRR